LGVIRKKFRIIHFTPILGGLMKQLEDASQVYKATRQVLHAERPGFRINELELSPGQAVPWHYHTNIQDTFYVLEGKIKISLCAPEEEIILEPCGTYSVQALRPHLVTNANSTSATFFVLQGVGEYDFIPIE
jgi:quercetin dioxygenase-like cupin family protein